MKKFLIKINGNAYEVEVEEINDNGSAAAPRIEAKPAVSAEPAREAVTPVKKEEPKNSAPVVNNKVPEGAEIIKAPMPGTILRISVEKSQAVKKGDVLLILEAMKMENEIVAPAEGTVASINVESGASVNAGDVLLSIAK